LLILFNIISLTVALNKHYLRKFNKNGFLEMPCCYKICPQNCSTISIPFFTSCGSSARPCPDCKGNTKTFNILQ
jgi:hypothetical protein